MAIPLIGNVLDAVKKPSDFGINLPGFGSPGQIGGDTGPSRSPAEPAIPVWDPNKKTPEATTTSYTANNALSRDMTATGSAASDMTADTRTVDKPTETVQGQLGSFLSSGSPILERARAGAMQQANSRGLINSTMAAQAGEAAALDAAVPIAQADANIYNQASGQNQAFRNQAASQNAQLGTQVDLANAEAANRASSQNAQLATQISQSNAEATNRAASQNAQLGTETSRFNADLEMKNILSMADNATKTSLARIEADYKVLMQGNVSASEIYRGTMTNISNILMNKDLDGPAKSAAIDHQIKLLQNGMALVGGMNGMTFTDANGNQVNLEDLLDFSALPEPTPEPKPDRDREEGSEQQAAG